MEGNIPTADGAGVLERCLCADLISKLATSQDLRGGNSSVSQVRYKI